jgi:hypothetical protein
MVRRLTIAAATLGLALSAAPAASAGDLRMKPVCGTAKDQYELVTRSGRGSKCRPGLRLMRGWRQADNPRRYRGYRCGDAPVADVEFKRGKRWFATWQCRRGAKTYRIWTEL